MIHARSEWTDRQVNFSQAQRGVSDVFIHHEGGAARGVPKDKAKVLREIEDGVLRKGYIAIDYNLMVFADGDIWEGRGLAHEDAATIHNNPTSVSICAVGNFEIEDAPDALISGIAQAIGLTAEAGWSTPHPRIRPHREVFATACPGHNLNARMDEIRNGLNVAPTRPKKVPMFLIRVMTHGVAGPTYVVNDSFRKRHMTSADEIAVCQGLLRNYDLPDAPIEVNAAQAMAIPDESGQ
ncbi:MAG: N-acetylmuramoyl-L-alanine amidase [Acidimicrobiia bacterium]